MRGKEFIDRAAAWARANGKAWRVEATRGKGSHKTLYVGDNRTTVPHGELPSGTYRSMLRQLGIRKEEF